MTEAIHAETAAIEPAVAFLAKFRRREIIAMTIVRHANAFKVVREESARLCRAALAERRRLRGPDKLARRLRRKVALGRSGSF